MFIRKNAVILSLLGIGIAILTASLTALALFQLGLIILCVLDYLLAPAARHLNITREAVTSCKMGDTVNTTFTLHNSGRMPISGSFRDIWPASAGVSPWQCDFHLKTQESRSYSLQLNPSRRGNIKSQFFAVRTFGPFSLAGKQKNLPSGWQIQVLPEFQARKHLPSRMRRLRELDGRALLLQRGEGTEFDSLREYIAGDDVRAIDWRSSARLNETVVRTWRPERNRKVVFILDSGRAGAVRADEYPAFDAFVETTLLTATLASRAGDQVEVFTLDTLIRGHVKGSKSEKLLHQIGVKIASIEPNLAFTDWQLALQELNRNVKQPALIIILTSVGVSSISDGLLHILPHLSKKHKVVIGAVVPDLPTPTVTYARLTASATNTPPQQASQLSNTPATTNTDTALYYDIAQKRRELERKTVIDKLIRLGAIVVGANSSNLPPQIADMYIELKATGKI